MAQNIVLKTYRTSDRYLAHHLIQIKIGSLQLKRKRTLIIIGWYLATSLTVAVLPDCGWN